MATHQIGLIGKLTGKVFVYEVDVPIGTPSADLSAFHSALAAHGQNILAGVVSELVQDDRAEVKYLD